MDRNAENDEEPVEERDGYDGEGDAEDSEWSSEPQPYEDVAETDASPDVFLDVPVLKVDEVDLDVENLRAHVSLQAEVLDLLKLNVGADVALGRVHLGISGVEAQAQLTVRLHNVAQIIGRVLTTLDRNPEMLTELAKGVGAAVQDVGTGAGQAVGELGTGAGTAVRDVGRGAGGAVQDVGRGAGAAVQDVGKGAGGAVRDVGGGAGRAVEDVGGGAGRAVEDVGDEVGGAVGEVGGGAGRAVEDVGDEVGEVAGGTAEEAGDTARGAVDTAGSAAEGAAEDAGTEAAEHPARSKPRRSADRDRARATRSRTGTRRVRAEDGKLPPRTSRRRTAEEQEDPP